MENSVDTLELSSFSMPNRPRFVYARRIKDWKYTRTQKAIRSGSQSLFPWKYSKNFLIMTQNKQNKQKNLAATPTKKLGQF